MNFCKGFVEKVCNHAYLRVLEEIKQLNFNKSIQQCSSCCLPFEGNICRGCNKTWCGREYYCKKTEKGVFYRCDQCGK
jgi:hypothetical protein